MFEANPTSRYRVWVPLLLMCRQMTGALDGSVYSKMDGGHDMQRMIAALRGIPFVLAVVFALVPFLAYGIDSGSQNSAVYSADELDRAYQSLSPEDRRAADQWPSSQREQYLKSRALAAREDTVETARAGAIRKRTSELEEQLRRSETPAQTRPAVDATLQRAYEAYLDENVPTDQAIGLFEQYLKEHPDTEFAAEIYFRIGCLYSMHVKEKLGERPAPERMVEYFQKAHHLWGRQYNSMNITAWASLINYTSDIKKKMEYYDWLQGLRKASPADVFAVRDISATFNGRSVALDASEKQAMIAHYVTLNLPNDLAAAEDNILYKVGYREDALVALANAYPGSPLGLEASRRLDRLGKAAMAAVEESLKGGPPATRPSVGRTPSIPKPIESQSTLPAGSPSRWTLWTSLGLVILVGGLLWWRRGNAHVG